MHKRFLLYIFVLAMVFPLTLPAQNKANVGIFAGTSYYMGDINPNRHFYRPSLAFGMIYRYNINTRYAIRANGYYADLSGNDLDFSRINPDRPVSPANFQTSIFDIGLQVEFNFLPYTPNFGKWEYTPYISSGIAMGMIMGSNTDAVNTLSFPLGIGVKVNLTSRLAAGAEWSFRKTFSDRIDGIENPAGKNSFIHNNDWYSFMGIFITYKFFNFAKTCPAYN
jgi:opacity protein-like surface antigen